MEICSPKPKLEVVFFSFLDKINEAEIGLKLMKENSPLSRHLHAQSQQYKH